MAFKGKVINNVTFDGTDLYVYSEEIYLRSSGLLSIGYKVAGTTPAGTFTLQAESINEEGELADQTDRTAEYDTGWVDLTSGHGWQGFPSGNPAGADTEDTVTVEGVGHRKLRVKFERTGGSGTLSVSVEVKPGLS